MRKFLASVGNAQLLGKVGGELKHIADVRTLTDSTLSFSNSMDEIRAGEGAQLYGRFSHDAGMTIQLTDAMFDINYVALQVGAKLTEGADGVGPAGLGSANPTVMYLDSHTPTAGATITIASGLDKTPAPLGVACGLNHKFVWMRENDCKASDEWTAVEIADDDSTIAVPAALQGKKICIRYFVEAPQARALFVNANFIPAELVLILTTKLFAGDANAPETGKAVGSITVKIPRFQLDGQFDLSMAMSSPSTMSLNGTALAVSDGSCDGAGVYCEIVEVEENSVAATGLKDVVISTDSTAASVTVYGLYADGHLATLASNVSESTGTDDIALGTVNGKVYTLDIAFATTVSVTATVNIDGVASSMTDTFTFPT